MTSKIFEAFMEGMFFGIWLTIAAYYAGRLWANGESNRYHSPK